MWCRCEDRNALGIMSVLQRKRDWFLCLAWLKSDLYLICHLIKRLMVKGSLWNCLQMDICVFFIALLCSLLYSDGSLQTSHRWIILVYKSVNLCSTINIQVPRKVTHSKVWVITIKLSNSWWTVSNISAGLDCWKLLHN